MSGIPKIRGNKLIQLNADFAERYRLKRIMTENSLDVLEVEFNVSMCSLVRMERNGFAPDSCPILGPEVVADVERRRKIYWLTREQYEPRYSDRALMARYDISKPTLLRRAQEFRQAQQQEQRRAA